MSVSVDQCVAQFPRQAIVIERTYARALAWAAFITAQPMPPAGEAPDKEVVRQRIVAEQMPARGSSYAPQIAPYLLEVPNIVDDVRVHLSEWNDEATDKGLATEIDNAFAVVMPKFASATIIDQEVANWCDQHGYPRPPDLFGVAPLP